MRLITCRRILISLIFFFASVWLVYRWVFPFGFSHYCDSALMAALTNYAMEHQKKYPSGGDTPTASLCRLFPEYVTPNLIAGKAGLSLAANDTLRHRGLFTPDQCGWYYVDGLSMDDDPILALFWDKYHLGHNGQILNGGGIKVFFVNGTSKIIAETEWDDFLLEQRNLYDQIRKREQK